MRKSTLSAICCVLVAGILTIVAGIGSSVNGKWFKNPNLATWFDSWGKDKQDIVSPDNSDKDKSDEGATPVLSVCSLELSENSIMALSSEVDADEPNVYTLTATVSPVTANFSRLIWTSDEEKLTVTPTGKMTATMVCTGVFSEQATISCYAEDYPEISAVCTVDCLSVAAGFNVVFTSTDGSKKVSSAIYGDQLGTDSDGNKYVAWHFDSANVNCLPFGYDYTLSLEALLSSCRTVGSVETIFKIYGVVIKVTERFAQLMQTFSFDYTSLSASGSDYLSSSVENYRTIVGGGYYRVPEVTKAFSFQSPYSFFSDTSIGKFATTIYGANAEDVFNSCFYRAAKQVEADAYETINHPSVEDLACVTITLQYAEYYPVNSEENAYLKIGEIPVYVVFDSNTYGVPVNGIELEKNNIVIVP